MLSMRTALAESIGVHIAVLGLLCLIPAYVFVSAPKRQPITHVIQFELAQARLPQIQVVDHEVARRTAVLQRTPPSKILIRPDEKKGYIGCGGAMSIATDSPDKSSYSVAWETASPATPAVCAFIDQIENDLFANLNRTVIGPLVTSERAQGFSQWDCEVGTDGRVRKVCKTSSTATAKVDEQVRRELNAMRLRPGPKHASPVTVHLNYRAKALEPDKPSFFTAWCALEPLPEQQKYTDYVARRADLACSGTQFLPDGAPPPQYILDLDVDGNVANIDTTISSGDETIDEEGRECIRRAGPFGKLPSGWQSFLITLQYEPHDSLPPASEQSLASKPPSVEAHDVEH